MMSHVNLIWIGSELPQRAKDAFEYWQSTNSKTIIHTDDSLLLPELRPVWNKHAKTPLLKSDLLRWSILHSVGGWYFDIDVRLSPNITLDYIENKYSFDNRVFCANLFEYSMLGTDVLASMPNSIGTNWVIDYMLKTLEQDKIRWLDYSVPMLDKAISTIPNAFLIGNNEDFNIDAKNPLVLRQGIWRKKMVEVSQSATVFPSLSTRLDTYLDSREKWVAAGKPLRTLERIEYIFNTFCKDCEYHSNYCCLKCGCFINLSFKGIFPNKIKWATTRCSLENPKWIEEENFQPKQKEEPKPPPPQTGGCGCHG